MTPCMTAIEFAGQTTRLESHVAELNQIDAAILNGAKAGTHLHSSDRIFGQLAEASIACAEVIETYGTRPIPANVRTGLFKVHCSITDLAASLKLYAVPTIRSS